MNKHTDFESTLQGRLDELRQVPARNPQAAARARARFLAQARAANEAQRHRGGGFIFRKQQFAMNVIVTILVIVGLLVGGGTTVKAAQDELPNQPLYGIKTLSEDISLQFQQNPDARLERLMELAQTRGQEMDQLIESGQTPPEQVGVRLEQHLQQALQLCSSMDDPALDHKLPQVDEQLRAYESNLQNLRGHAAQGAQPILDHTLTMLQTQVHIVDNGLTNHASFRSMVQNGFHYETTQTPSSVEVPSKGSLPNGKQNGQETSQPGNQGNSGEALQPQPAPGQAQPHVIPTPKNNNVNPGNNAGGNDKNKDKPPKDKGSNGNDQNGNGNDNGKGNGNGNGNGSGGGNPNQ